MDAPKNQPQAKRHGGRRRPSGRRANPDRTSMEVPLDPADGITDELLAVSKKTGIPTGDIAHAILMFNRGRFDMVFERMRVVPLTVGVPPGETANP